MVKHKQSQEYRVVNRGRSWFVQRLSENKGSKTYDPWYDLGKPKDTQDEAIKAMYQVLPMKPKAETGN